MILKHIPLLFFVLLTGCSCEDVLSEQMDASKKYVARVSLEGPCGGATVGYHTEVTIVNRIPTMWPRGRTLLLLPGKVDLTVRWLDASTLLVEYPPDQSKADCEVASWNEVRIRCQPR